MTTTTAVLDPVRAMPRLAEASGLVVCLATGPSLTQADVDRVRGRATVIAVNDAHRLAPWADVLYSSDRYWWKHHKGVPSFGGLKACIEYSPGRYSQDLLKLVPEMHFFRLTGHTGVETHPLGLRTCGGNSGGSAVNLAVHLGARTIVLLGYDMGYGAEGQRHFFGDHPQTLSQRHNFPHWRQCFRTMAEPFRAMGLEVINCTRRTSLNAFPCRPLEEVFA